MSEPVEAFDPSLKKKKKKKTLILDGDEAGAGGEVQADTSESGEIQFGSKKKKKSKEKNLAAAGSGEGDDVVDAAKQAENDEDAKLSLQPWQYSYEDLLTRVYNIMYKKNPDMESGGKKKLIMQPPQCLRVGSKKTAWANFVEICSMLKRAPKHVLQFLLAELGTSGSLDGNNQLIIKGRFQQKQFESVLRNYIKEYVTCHTCKSPNTTLQKDTRLNFLQCEVCGSRCSVAAIKAGFSAQVTRRAAARAAAGQ